MGRRTGILESGRVLYLPLGSIRPNPAQPRRVFDPAGLQELADSIREYGILQPLTVRRRENGYELIAGERRLRAAGMAGLTQAPCLVAAVDEEASGMLALVENLQRRDLDFIEEAEGLARLMKTWGLSQEQAARKVGKSQSAVANKLRLLRLSPSVLAELRLHGLSERHARALLKLRSEDEQLRVVGQIVQGGWTVANSAASSCGTCACFSTRSTASSTSSARRASTRSRSGRKQSARSSSPFASQSGKPCVVNGEF